MLGAGRWDMAFGSIISNPLEFVWDFLRVVRLFRHQSSVIGPPTSVSLNLEPGILNFESDGQRLGLSSFLCALSEQRERAVGAFCYCERQ
jgi:hypothetical protein